MSLARPLPLGTGRRPLLAWLLIGLLFGWPVLADRPVPPPLFASPAAVLRIAQNAVVSPAFTHQRLVTVNRQALLGEALKLNLYQGLTLAAERQHYHALPQGGQAWIGQLEGELAGQVVLVASGEVLAGHIHSVAGDFVVRYAGGGLHHIYQVNGGAFPLEAEPLLPTPGLDAAAAAGPETATDDGSLIDVLVLYTPAALAQVGGPDAIKALANLAVIETNLAYANSGVFQRLQLAHLALLAYTESGSFSTDLGRLQAVQDGYLDDAHALRDQYGADLVSLLVGQDRQYCGIAYLMNAALVGPGFAPWAFSVVGQDCAAGYYSFGHELGHNMGSQHDRANAGSAGAYTYSYGYQDPQARFRTIMAYNCPGGCPRIPYFSNPAVGYLGLPTGINSMAPNSADNDQTLNNTALVVANFRPSRSASATPTPTPPTGLTPAPAGPQPYRIFLSWVQ
jgi:hypothetical protein